VLLASLAEHLDRVALVLTAVTHAETDDAVLAADIRERARDLVWVNRLFRQHLSAGDRAAAQLLDAAERVLTEVASDEWSGNDDDVSMLTRRVDEQSLLFKIRVVSNDLRARQSQASHRLTAPTS
jgi:hypothetical protein